MEAKKLYYCNKCGYVGTDVVVGGFNACPKCKSQLFYTDMDVDEWEKMSDEQKSTNISMWSNRSKSNNTSGQRQSGTGNSIANLLKIISYVVLVLGLIASIIWASDEEVFFAFVIGAAGSVVAFAPIRGFAEVIELLQQIRDK